jgi:hypothetical protein
MLDDCIKSFQDKGLINEIDVRMQCVWFLRAHAMRSCLLGRAHACIESSTHMTEIDACA